MKDITVLKKYYEDYDVLTYTMIQVKTDDHTWTIILDESWEDCITVNNIIDIDKLHIHHIVHASSMLVAKLYPTAKQIRINNELFRSDKVEPIRQFTSSVLETEDLRIEFDKRYSLHEV